METQNGTEKLGASRAKSWWIFILIATVFVLISLRLFVVAVYRTPSASMEDTLLVGDRILVAKFVYGVKIPFSDIQILNFHKPEVGDIIVFKPPPKAGRTQKFVKRIVGLPGDDIEFRDGRLYRNGEQVVGEDYVKRLPTPSTRRGRMNSPPFTVPPEHVFVLGDNRDRSADSRLWGTVPIGNIEGQAFLISRW